MANNESATGTSDTRYNLTSVLYHALEGGATYAGYVEDAEREGDQELARFFREVQEEDAKRAQKAQDFLQQRLSATKSGPEEPGKIYNL
jgi:rubrerythrin